MHAPCSPSVLRFAALALILPCRQQPVRLAQRGHGHRDHPDRRDVNGGSLTFAVVASPAHGTRSGTAPNLTYTPAPDYHGPDSFTFKARMPHSPLRVIDADGDVLVQR